MSFRSILAESARSLLDKGLHVRTEDVVSEARRRNPTLFVAEQERLAIAEAERLVKELFREITQDDHALDDQMSLPDIMLPTAIAVEDEGGGFSYVKAMKAHRADLRAGRAQRISNVARAQKRLDQYDESLDLLLPVMTDDEMTVEEALRIVGAQS